MPRRVRIAWRQAAVGGVVAEDEDPEIMAVLAKLAGQDAATAEDARAALEWIAGDQGLALITQQRIQNFCWYELPVKWLVDLDDKLRVVAALAQALDLLHLPRYAAICRSGTTREILNAYETSIAQGKAAFRRAATASGIMPPDLSDFQWGPAMGFEEASAWSSTAEFLEVAVASGDLVPGRRGWKARQQELVRAHLNVAQAGLLGQTLAQVILTERAETWVNARRSETRRRILAAIANRLLHPAELPPPQLPTPFPCCAGCWTSWTAASPSPRPAISTGSSSKTARTGSGGTSPARRGPRTTCSTCTSCATSPRTWGWPAGRAASSR